MTALDTQDIATFIEAIDLLDRPTTSEAAAQLRRQLNSTYLALGQIESYIGVCRSALRAQAADVDVAVAAVLDGAVGLLHDASGSLDAAFNLLPELPAPKLTESVADLREKLRAMQGGVA